MWLNPDAPSPLAGVRIAVARDAAFAFLYRANLELLRALGAELTFFSPLADPDLPLAEALYLPGGYPELHLERLAANQAMLAGVRAHHAADKPILAECGGMLYLLESLTDQQGRTANLAGLLPGRGLMGDRLANLGMHEIDLPEGTLRGHGFHYSRLETPLEPIAWSRPRRGRQGEPAYRLGSLLASYLHLYFPSNPAALARIFTPNCHEAASHTPEDERPAGLFHANRPLPAEERNRLLATPACHPEDLSDGSTL